MRRTRLDIIINIMEEATMGVNKTSIVYRTNLNFTLADKYLDMLQKQGFIETRSEKYKTTEKGIKFLEKAKEVAQQLEEPNPIPL